MKNRWQDLREMLKMNMSWLVQIARKSYLSSARLLPLCRIHFLCASAHFFLFAIVVIVTTDTLIIVITITILAIIVISNDSLQS